MNRKVIKLILFVSLLQIIYVSHLFGLELEQVLEEIKNLPIEKIKFKQFETDKLKAIQIFVLPKTQKELEEQMIIWKNCGINTLILRVFHNEGDRYHFFIDSPLKKGVYFKTKHAPLISDTLGFFIPIAKEYGFKVYAWMTTRYADFNGDLEKVVAYSPTKKNYYYARGINILSENVKHYLNALYTDLAEYPIDGILLQDDLFLRYNEGLDKDTFGKFKYETGLNISPQNLFLTNGDEKHVKYSEEFWIWREWKSKKIAEFIGDLRKNLKKINPSLKIVVNLTYEAISHPKGALAWLAHDIEELKNVSDYFSLMAYHRQIMEELNINKEFSFLYLADMIEKCIQKFPEDPQRILFKLQIKDWKTNEAISDRELLELMRYAKNIDKLSLALVPYPPQPSYEILKSFFSGR